MIGAASIQSYARSALKEAESFSAEFLSLLQVDVTGVEHHD
jgi:hypothetical protein